MGYISHIACGILILGAAAASPEDFSPSDVATMILHGKQAEARSALRTMGNSGDASRDMLLFFRGLLATNGDTARILYEDLVRLYPQSKYADDALFRLGQYRYARGLYQSAIQDFSRIESDFRNSPLIKSSRYWIGLCRQAMGAPGSETEYDPGRGSEAEDALLSEIINVVENDQEGANHANAPPPADPGSAAPPPVHFAIQVGAFSGQNRALMQKSFFEKNGYVVHLRNKMSDGQQLYVVWVGNLATRSEADALKAEISRKFDIRGFVVTE